VGLVKNMGKYGVRKTMPVAGCLVEEKLRNENKSLEPQVSPKLKASVINERFDDQRRRTKKGR
jgi:hypothetical protein